MKCLLRTSLALAAAGATLFAASAFADEASRAAVTARDVSSPAGQIQVVPAAISPYCENTYTFDVEPITLLRINDIDNTSSPTSTNPHEDFTDVIGWLRPGATYAVTISAVTGGNFNHGNVLYVDWNQDLDFTDPGEGYWLGINNETDPDIETITAYITVPEDALVGTTRLRAMSAYNVTSLAGLPPCRTGTGYGQSEDYTVIVDPSAPVPELPIAVSAEFSPAVVEVSGNATLTFTLGNLGPDDSVLTDDFTVDLPAGMSLASAAVTTCDGIVTGGTGDPSFTLATGAIVPGEDSCTVSAQVAFTAGGNYTVAGSATNSAGTTIGSASVFAYDYAGSTAYSTGFEAPFTPGAINNQELWFGSSPTGAVISATRPANGAQHLRITSTTSGNILALSPTFTGGTTRYVAMSANIAINNTGANFELDPQDPDAGAVTTRIRFSGAAGRSIDVVDWDNLVYTPTGATWPLDTYFNLKLLVDRATNNIRLCIDGAQVYETTDGTGTTGNNTVENVAVLQLSGAGQSSGRTYDVDDLDVTYSNSYECDGSLPSFTVTPGTTGNGTITPDTAQVVELLDTVDFTLAADAGNHLVDVTGTCPGTLAGNIYTAGPITGDCTVIANFAPDGSGTPIVDVTPASLSLTAVEGDSASDTLTIANLGDGPLTWSLTEEPAFAPSPAASAKAGRLADPAMVAMVSARDASVPASVTPPRPNPGQRGGAVIDEGFADVESLVTTGGWFRVNKSDPLGGANWIQCGGTAIPPAFDGDTNDCTLVNYTSTTGAGTISNWLVTKEITFTPGMTLSFYTRTGGTGTFPDRLEVRACDSGDCTDVGVGANDVGNFTTLLFSVNPDLLPGIDPTGVNGYPNTWTQFTVTNLPTSGTGRIAFRYFVTNGGPEGTNSNIIGLDRVVVDSGSPPPDDCENPADVPWLDVSSTGGIVAPSAQETLTVTVDAGSLSAGNYSAKLCVASDDPANPLVVVPVSFEVTPAGGGDNEVLVIDLSVANQVTISGTSGVSMNDATGSTTTGFYFQDFLVNTPSLPIGTPAIVGTATLAPASVSSNGNPRLYHNSTSADPGLNIWGYSSTTTTTFTAGQTAFAGTATWTLSPEVYIDFLQAPATGNVYFPADEASDLGTAVQIGTYRVIFPAGGDPEIDVDPTSLDASVVEGGSTTRTLTIANVAGPASDALDWAIDEAETAPGCANPGDVAWLSLSSTAGTLSAGSDETVTVTFDASSLAAGSYDALLCVNSNDPANDLVQVPVTLTVTAAGGSGDLTVSPTHVDLEVTVGTAASETLTVANNGTSSIDWTVVPEVVTALSEDFEGVFPPAGWSLQDNSTTACPWFQTDGTGLSGFVAAPGGSMGAAINVDACGSGQTYNSSLITPEVDLTGFSQAVLRFDLSYRHLSTVNLYIDVSTDGGANWANVHAYTASVGYTGAPVAQEIDLSAYAGQPVTLRFRWQSGWTWWAFIDNLEVVARDGAIWPASCWSPSIDWLTVSPTDGTLAASASEAVTVGVPDTVAPGIYATELCFAGYDGSTVHTAVVPVEVTVKAPSITVDPTSISAAVDPGQTVTETLTIGNTGDGALIYTIDEAPAGTVNPRAHFPATDRSVNAPYDPATTWEAERVSPEVLAKLEQEALRKSEHARLERNRGSGMQVPAYSNTGWTHSDFVMLDAEVPGVLTTIRDPQVDTIYAAGFLNNDFSRQFFVAGAPGTDAVLALGAYGWLDTTTGDYTQLGVVANPAGITNWTSLSQDPTTGEVYLVGLGSDSRLYTIDPSNGNLQFVGVIGGYTGVVAIAFSPEGLLYGIDIVTDELLAIDKTNGGAAAIGPLGGNANFAQDMDFDQSTGTLYWAAYFGSGNSQMMKVDTSTGAATPIGPIQDGAELLSFSIAVASGNCSDPADVPWLSVSSSGGTIQPGDADHSVTVTMDSTGLPDGLYEASVCIRSNDPARRVVEVPVSFQVGESVDPNADLALSMFSVPSTVNAGDSVSIVAAVANFGPSDAVDVTVEMELPADFAFVSGLLVEGSGNWACSAAGQTVTCDLVAGTLPTGTFAAVLQVNANVASGAEDGVALTTGTVSSSNPDPNAGNNSASASTTIIGGPSDLIFANGFDPDAPECEPIQLLQDTSFEATDPDSYLNPFWPDHSDAFGGVLCDVAACGTGGGTAAPRSGSFWAWLGGISQPEVAWVEQSVVIPPSPERHLNFWLWIGAVNGGGSTLQIQVDGNTVHTINEPGSPDAGYVPHSVDLSQYADGNSHTIRFRYQSSTPLLANYNLDDVTLECTPH